MKQPSTQICDIRKIRPGKLSIGMAGALLLALSGCRTPVASADLSGFGTAAAGIAHQAGAAFTQSNTLARSVSAERFIRSGRPGLSEDAFLVAISPSDIAAWQFAFTRLEEYGAALGSLSDESRGTAVSDSLLDLGKELNSGVAHTSISPGVASGFASLGGAIISAKQDHEARKVLEATDPAVQQITSSMADAIGAADNEGLRGTVRSNWIASFQETRGSYAVAATQHDLAQQRALVNDYLAGLDRRDAQLKSLADLRSSIIALGAAHAAAAAGKPASVKNLLAIVAERAEETARLYDDFTANPK